MKKICLYTLPVVALALASCADSYEGNLSLEKPESVIKAEQLAALGALNSYVDRSQSPDFKLGLTVSSADYANHGLTYSIALSNFDFVVDASAIAYSSIITEDGSYALNNLTDMFLSDGTGVASGAMLAYNNVPKAYLENVISANFVKGDYQSGIHTIADFDSEAEGTEYAMSNGSVAAVAADPAGGEGFVLQIGSPDSKAKNSFATINVSLPDDLTLANCYSVTFDLYCVDDKSLKRPFAILVNGVRKNFTGDTPEKRGCSNGQWIRKLALDMSGIELSADDLAASTFTLAFGPNVNSSYYYIDNVNINWESGEHDKYVEKTDEEKTQALIDNFGLWANTVMGATASNITDYVVLANPMSDSDTYMLRNAENELECLNDTTGCFFFNDYMGDNYLRTVTDSLARAYSAAGGQGSPKFYVSESGLLANPGKTQRFVDQINDWTSAGAKIDGIAVNLPLAYSADPAEQAANRSAVDDLFTALATTGKLIRLDNVSMANADADFYSYVLSSYCSKIPAAKRAGIVFANTADLWKNNARTDVYEAIANAISNK